MKLELVIVVASIGCENVAETVVVTGTLVAPDTGTVDVTVGGPVDADGTTSIAVTSGSSTEP